MTQTAHKPAPAKVLPFRVIAYRVPARDFEQIEGYIKFVAHIIGLDAPLDWEDRNTACRQLHDALCALAEIKKASDFRL
jgi:heme oxygenase